MIQIVLMVAHQMVCVLKTREMKTMMVLEIYAMAARMIRIKLLQEHVAAASLMLTLIVMV